MHCIRGKFAVALPKNSKNHYNLQGPSKFSEIIREEIGKFFVWYNNCYSGEDTYLSRLEKRLCIKYPAVMSMDLDHFPCLRLFP
jgi:hypothetical protein